MPLGGTYGLGSRIGRGLRVSASGGTIQRHSAANAPRATTTDDLFLGNPDMMGGVDVNFQLGRCISRHGQSCNRGDLAAPQMEPWALANDENCSSSS